MIRRRFLDVYKRDVQEMQELKGSKAIREGNSIAHDGDVIGDALLYDKDKRTDTKVFQELYGLDYLKILDFSKQKDFLVNS